MTTAIQIQDIGIIILAAGSSQRFAGDKRQARLANGQTLLEKTLENIPATFSKRILVLHAGDDELAEKFSDDWSICIAENAQQGMGNSLACAIGQQDNWQGLLVGLGDMPLIQAKTYSDLQQALCKHELVIPMFKGKRGNPVGFQAKYFAQLSCLKGDQGARKLLQENAHLCHQYETDDEGIVKDIDTVDALKQLLTP